ncbi:MAG: ABC transporter substrate-binding protein, partial [Corynebacterium sp.]
MNSTNRTARTARTVLAAPTSLATLLALAACGDGNGGAAASDYDGDIGSTDLSSVCPETVVVQTDWFPEAEHGHLYEQLDYDGEGRDAVSIDADGKVVSGPLFDGDNGYTGVDLEIRSGGPAIGNQ